MPDILSAVIVIVFMIALSLVLNFIGSTFLELAIAVSDKMVQRKKHLNNSDPHQYDNTGDDNDVETPKVTL
jgi:hypothetical protein